MTRANRTETLPDVWHTADISLSPRMAGQIAGVFAPLTSFCCSFRGHAAMKKKIQQNTRALLRQETRAVRAGVFVAKTQLMPTED